MTARPRRIRGAAFAIATGALVSLDAGAAPVPSRVLIVREHGADPVIDRAEVRLAAELRAAGFEVEERVVEGDADARQLVEEPGVVGPFATVLLRRAGGRAATDVWVADHVTHKTVVRRIAAQAGESSDRALALRVVELMRASLVEPLVLPAPEAEPNPSSPGASPSSPPSAPASPQQPTTPAAPPADVLRWAREAIREPAAASSPRFGFAIGVAGLIAGPDVGPAAGPALRVTWRPAPAWTVGLFGASTSFGGDIAARPEGSASTRQDLGLLEFGWEYAATAALHVQICVGGGAYHVVATGDASAGFVSLRDDTWTGLGAGGMGLRWRMSPAASLVIDARELLAFPRPIVEFANERVAAAMRPGTLAAVSLSVDL
jgi:hypothetical protein